MNSLTTYRNEITLHHQQAQIKAGEAVEHAMKAGKLLNAAKDEAQHGQWLSFLESTGVNTRTAQRYMRLAKHEAELKCDSVSHLSVSQALKYLSEPKIEPPVAGEYLYLKENNEQLWVWPYSDGFYHRVSVIEDGDGGCFNTVTKRAINWEWMRKQYPDVARMKKMTDSLVEAAFIYREATLGGDLNCGENYNPLEPWVSPNKEVALC